MYVNPEMRKDRDEKVDKSKVFYYIQEKALYVICLGISDLFAVNTLR
jgi:hypothetical protein